MRTVFVDVQAHGSAMGQEDSWTSVRHLSGRVRSLRGDAFASSVALDQAPARSIRGRAVHGARQR
jgi:hypothetical protein